KNDFEITILFHGKSGPICDYYKKENIPYTVIPYPRLLPVIKKIRQFQPDTIHLFGLKTNVLWRPLLSLFGYRRLIGHIAGLSNTGEHPGWFRLWIDRITAHWLLIYLANSQKVADQLAAFGFPKNKLRVIHNGVPVKDRLASKSPHEPAIILTAGNLRAVKGQSYLIDAFKRLKERPVPFQAWIVGTG